jgi:hypothetical protein
MAHFKIFLLYYLQNSFSVHKIGINRLITKNIYMTIFFIQDNMLS